MMEQEKVTLDICSLTLYNILVFIYCYHFKNQTNLFKHIYFILIFLLVKNLKIKNYLLIVNSLNFIVF